MGTRESTPKPGNVISSSKARLVVEEFSLNFRSHMDATLVEKVPMACALHGTVIGNDFAKLPIPDDSQVYAFYENTDELFRTTIKAMVHYLQSRAPWEDYDICIFDPSFNWCLAVSHKDRCVWVMKDK